MRKLLRAYYGRYRSAISTEESTTRMTATMRPSGAQLERMTSLPLRSPKKRDSMASPESATKA